MSVARGTAKVEKRINPFKTKKEMKRRKISTPGECAHEVAGGGASIRDMLVY